MAEPRGRTAGTPHRTAAHPGGHGAAPCPGRRARDPARTHPRPGARTDPGHQPLPSSPACLAESAATRLGSAVAVGPFTRASPTLLTRSSGAAFIRAGSRSARAYPGQLVVVSQDVVDARPARIAARECVQSQPCLKTAAASGSSAGTSRRTCPPRSAYRLRDPDIRVMTPFPYQLFGVRPPHPNWSCGTTAHFRPSKRTGSIQQWPTGISMRRDADSVGLDDGSCVAGPVERAVGAASPVGAAGSEVQPPPRLTAAMTSTNRRNSLMTPRRANARDGSVLQQRTLIGMRVR